MTYTKGNEPPPDVVVCRGSDGKLWATAATAATAAAAAGLERFEVYVTLTGALTSKFCGKCR